ncbi:MAG TPA: sigma-54-dependent Fis family transcriptional regulator [Deltaproteobacteria bacterium]|nr:sigma-54-dependent Fis family transcriptional regulator [Deltaproteobacteria bacterium]
MTDRTQNAVKILIIDDEPVICNGCRLALAENGHATDVCHTGKAGLERINRDPPDIILLDLKLPDMEGMEILEKVREEYPSSFTIVMTGYSTIESAVEAMKLGAIDYLPKPFSNDQLLLTVERALEKKRLLEENRALRKELVDRFGFNNIIGENQRILTIFREIQKVAPTDCTVLLCGESGTGKELFARAVHAHSRRSGCQFVAVDCSTISPTLLESELFGHVKGAFTGAVQNKAGIFEVADGGTLFLDDVANLSWEIQGKLLRVLEMHEYKPVGASTIKRTNARIIAATNKDLRVMAGEGQFREDLFYRFNVFPIYLPPLRERKDDIPRLAYHFLRHFCRKTGKRIQGFSDDALELLIHQDWPGNVRQLKNVIERLVILSEQPYLNLMDLFDHLHHTRPWGKNSIPETYAELKAVKKHLLEQVFSETEKAFLLNALKASSGNITHAAERVGMQRSNFHTLIRKHHLATSSPPSDRI